LLRPSQLAVRVYGEGIPIPTTYSEAGVAKLYFYYSTMNAGKSTALLQAAHNYAERGMRTLLFTAQLDARAGGRIASRIGIGADAHHFGPDTDFRVVCPADHLHCVLVDEAQFLSRDQVWQLTRVVDDAGIPVMCYGLRTDFRGELFPGSAALLAWADTLVELKTICICGRKATMVVRVSPVGAVEREGQQVEIGGNERYVPLCRRHFADAVTTGLCPGWESVQ
jgi:thymidine kinase